MFDEKLVRQAIESAKCRIYRLKANQGDTLAHQRKAEKQIELQRVTIAALEMQIAKKPIIEPWSPARCPNCDCELSESIGDGYYKHWYGLNICECGQKLKWED